MQGEQTENKQKNIGRGTNHEQNLSRGTKHKHAKIYVVLRG